MSKNLSVKGFAAEVGIGLTKAYQIMNDPAFPSFRIGRKLMVSIEDVTAWQQKQIELYAVEKSRN